MHCQTTHVIVETVHMHVETVHMHDERQQEKETGAMSITKTPALMSVQNMLHVKSITQKPCVMKQNFVRRC